MDIFDEYLPYRLKFCLNSFICIYFFRSVCDASDYVALHTKWYKAVQVDVICSMWLSFLLIAELSYLPDYLIILLGLLFQLHLCCEYHIWVDR